MNIVSFAEYVVIREAHNPDDPNTFASQQRYGMFVPINPSTLVTFFRRNPDRALRIRDYRFFAQAFRTAMRKYGIDADLADPNADPALMTDLVSKFYGDAPEAPKKQETSLPARSPEGKLKPKAPPGSFVLVRRKPGQTPAASSYASAAKRQPIPIQTEV